MQSEFAVPVGPLHAALPPSAHPGEPNATADRSAVTDSEIVAEDRVAVADLTR